MKDGDLGFGMRHLLEGVQCFLHRFNHLGSLEDVQDVWIASEGIYAASGNWKESTHSPLQEPVAARIKAEQGLAGTAPSLIYVLTVTERSERF